MKVNQSDLEEVYRQSLELDIIKRIAEVKQLELRVAMDIYYRSSLAKLISEGVCGIQYLSVNYLADDLIENEPELFN